MLTDHLLIHAVMLGNLKKVNHLLTTQPQLIAEADSEDGYTALHCAAWYADLGTYTHHTQIFSALLFKAIELGTTKILLNIQSNIGSTPLTHALDKAKTTDDIFAKRAVVMIQHGATLPDTPHAKWIWGKLTIALQEFIQQKLTAAKLQQPTQNALPQYEKMQNNSLPINSTGIHHRTSTANMQRDIELSIFDTSFRK